jgi:hypothetical protein
MTFAREPLEMVEIIQPLCSRVFGTSPCLATGDKCWNTNATCKFRSALNLVNTLSLQFVRDLAHEWITTAGAYQPALGIPALVSYQTAPTILNIASGSKNKSPLGYRGVCQITIKDFPWNDVGTDPYLSSRSYTPELQGSFWSKWLARNPNHVGFIVRIYEGFRGDALVDMTKREYIIEKIDFGRNGVSITAKDILRKVTDTNVNAPTLSPGELASALTVDATTIQVAGAVLDDYPSTGFLRIGSEVVSYTSRALNAFSNIVFSGVVRGVLNTEAASASQNAKVQRVLVYNNVRFDDILYDLLVTWGKIDASYIDFAAWQAEADEWRPEFIFTAYLTETNKVEDLVAEICLQALVSVWWDERVQKIILRSQRPDVAPPLISDDANIIAGSLSIKELPEERASQIHVYYLPRSVTGSVTDKFNYERAAVFINVDKQIEYGGEPQVRELFCRFIQTDAIANNLAATYLNRFQDVRREISFSLADESTYWTGDNLTINHFLDVDFTGAAKQNTWIITSAEAQINGSVYSFIAEDNDMVGILWEWVDDSIPEWSSATDEQKATIGYWLTDDDTDIDGNPRPFRWL